MIETGAEDRVPGALELASPDAGPLAAPPAAPTASRIPATIFVVLSACCFGSIPVLTSIALSAGTPLTSVLFWRYAIGGVLLVVAAGGLKAIASPGRSAIPMLVLAGGGQAVIGYVSLAALRYLPAATLTFLFYTYPAWVAVIGALRRTERLTTRRAVALTLSLVGIVVMAGNPWGGGLHPVGIALALTSALLYAAYIPLLDHFQRVAPAPVTAAYASGGAALALTIGGALTGTLTAQLAPAAWGAAITMGVVCTAVAFLAFLRGLRTLGPVRAAIVSTVEPFWSALLATVVLGQPLTPRTVIGGAMIAGAVVVLSRR